MQNSSPSLPPWVSTNAFSALLFSAKLSKARSEHFAERTHSHWLTFTKVGCQKNIWCKNSGEYDIICWLKWRIAYLSDDWLFLSSWQSISKLATNVLNGFSVNLRPPPPSQPPCLWHAGMHITANGFRQQVRDVPCHAFHASSSEYVVFFLSTAAAAARWAARGFARCACLT